MLSVFLTLGLMASHMPHKMLSQKGKMNYAFWIFLLLIFIVQSQEFLEEGPFTHVTWIKSLFLYLQGLKDIAH
jgi:hypothetical protein